MAEGPAVWGSRARFDPKTFNPVSVIQFGVFDLVSVCKFSSRLS